VTLEATNLTYALSTGYYIKNMKILNNVFNIDHLSFGLFGTQRNDANVICEDNIFQIGPCHNVTASNAPRLFSSALGV
jgi:hypothetical protein